MTDGGEGGTLSSETIAARIERATAGDRDALLELLLDSQRELGNFVASQLRNTQDTHVNDEDILQESFIDAFAGIDKLQARTWEGFLGWVKQIALNRIRDTLRKRNAKKRGGDFRRVEKRQSPFQSHALELVNELSCHDNSPSQFVAKKEAADAIKIAIAQLPDEQRTAIQYVSFEKMTLAQTAERMGKTSDAVRGLLQRAKKSIKESLHKSTLWLSRKA